MRQSKISHVKNPPILPIRHPKLETERIRIAVRGRADGTGPVESGENRLIEDGITRGRSHAGAADASVGTDVKTDGNPQLIVQACRFGPCAADSRLHPLK